MWMYVTTYGLSSLSTPACQRFNNKIKSYFEDDGNHMQQKLYINLLLHTQFCMSFIVNTPTDIPGNEQSQLFSIGKPDQAKLLLK